eukprot:493000_1
MLNIYQLKLFSPTMSSVCILLAMAIFILTNTFCVDGYHCILIEDEIPSPFTDKHCVEKVKKLVAKQSEFSVEIASSNKPLLLEIKNIINNNNYIGEFINEGTLSRAFESFISEGIKQG